MPEFKLGQCVVVSPSSRPPQNAIISSLDRLLSHGQLELTFCDELSNQSVWAPLNFNGENIYLDSTEVTHECDNLLLTVWSQTDITSSETEHPPPFFFVGQLQVSLWSLWPQLSWRNFRDKASQKEDRP